MYSQVPPTQYEHSSNCYYHSSLIIIINMMMTIINYFLSQCHALVKDLTYSPPINLWRTSAGLTSNILAGPHLTLPFTLLSTPSAYSVFYQKGQHAQFTLYLVRQGMGSQLDPEAGLTLGSMSSAPYTSSLRSSVQECP